MKFVVLACQKLRTKPEMRGPIFILSLRPVLCVAAKKFTAERCEVISNNVTKPSNNKTVDAVGETLPIVVRPCLGGCI